MRWIIRRFKGLGLKAVLVGYETFKEEELRAYEKKSDIEDNLKASWFMKEIGLDVWASFMLHRDGNKEDFRGLRRYLRALKPEISAFSPLIPFPNLPLYEEYRDRLLVEREAYESWSFGQVTIRPSKMSLRRYYYEMLKTNLYVNLFQNNTAYMVRKFGFATVFRLCKGSIHLLKRYMKRMMQ